MGEKNVLTPNGKIADVIFGALRRGKI